MSQLLEKQICDPVTFVIFGASGDLTHRKLIPALYAAFQQKLLPDQFSIIGFARRDYDTTLFRKMMSDAVSNFSRLEIDSQLLEKFVKHIDYFKGDISSEDSYSKLSDKLSDNSKYPENHIYYLSIIPNLFEIVVSSLKKANLVSAPQGEPWSRVVVEKPFGRDLVSAKNWIVNYYDT